MLERHDFAPDFILPTAAGVRTRFYGIGGGRTTLLAMSVDAGALVELAALARETDTPLFAVHAAAPAAETDGAVDFVDADGTVRGRYGAGDTACVFVLSENLRVIAACDADLAADARAVLAVATQDAPIHAPVLSIPAVLDAAYCLGLCEMVDAHGEPTGVEVSADGARRNEIQAGLKRRRDYIVDDAALMKELTRRVGKRVIPEVHKAFSFHATRFEGFKLCRYDADDGGFFARHRDNLSPATAHRRFALTLNLNDDYDGGALQFPEYGAAQYRPSTGGAIVFSGSLLHEALKVTRGRRYVLLSFLYGDGDRAKNLPR